jgi:hypothetical protein
MPKRIIQRINAPRAPRGTVYKSYSVRFLKRELKQLQRVARRKGFSFNSWIVSTLVDEANRIAAAEESREVGDGRATEDGAAAAASSAGAV